MRRWKSTVLGAMVSCGLFVSLATPASANSAWVVVKNLDGSTGGIGAATGGAPYDYWFDVSADLPATGSANMCAVTQLAYNGSGTPENPWVNSVTDCSRGNGAVWGSDHAQFNAYIRVCLRSAALPVITRCGDAAVLADDGTV